MQNGRDKDTPPDLAELEKRLKRARKPQLEGEQQPTSRGSALGFGFRIAIDLVCAVAVGFGAGFGLDWWLETSPWFLLILTPLGVAAGILNVVRAATAEEAKRQAAALDNGE